jgi:hypothetical protein
VARILPYQPPRAAAPKRFDPEAHAAWLRRRLSLATRVAEGVVSGARSAMEALRVRRLLTNVDVQVRVAERLGVGVLRPR